MKKILFIFATILMVLSAQAQQQVKQGTTKYDQLKTDDIVTISRDNGGNSRTYFTIENNAIAAHNEPNVNSLWRIVYCAYQKFNWGDQNIYQLQHLKSGKYLRVDASGSGNRVTIRFSASDNNDAYSTFSQNNPGNQINGAEQGHLNYYYDNRDFYIKLQNNNTWVLQTGTNNRPTLFVEKWTPHTSTSFETYFSPETYDFGLVKAKQQDGQTLVADDEVVANKTIRFVMDKRETTIYKCVRDNNRKQIEFGSTVQNDLVQMGITTPTFTWQSSKDATSMLTLTQGGYSSTTETGRQMMTIDQENIKISDDKLAYEIPIQAFGKSPLNLKHTHNAGVTTWSNYVDYLVASWSYGENKYTASARVVRKSYHTKDLPPFEYSTSPSTFTFEGTGGSQSFKINGVHQHGTAYYDVDGRIADKDYEYEPVPMPIAEKEGELSYAFTFEDLNGNTIDWLRHNYDDIKNKIQQGTTPDTTITVKANANDAPNAAYRQARLHGVVTLTAERGGELHTHEENIYIPINQRAVGGENITFTHQEGASYKNKDNDPENDLDKNHRQQVHTAERTIYYTSGQREIKLQLAESNFFGYMRWYDYDSNGDGGDPMWHIDENKRTSWATAPRGANGTNFKAINTSYGQSRGLYGTNGEVLDQGSENNPAPLLKGWTYGTYDPTQPTDDQKAKAIHTIACDVSAYTDYEITKNGNRVTSIKEPTLSYRQLFHLRPAEEIAKQLNEKSHLTTPEYLENYKYRAAVGADVHLATKYRYKSYSGSHESELCYFYYNQKNELKRIGKDVQAKWFIVNKDGTETQITNPEYQVYDYLNIDSDKAETVVYVLKVPAYDTGNSADTRLEKDLLIARFEVIFVNINECGPRKDAIISDHDITEHFISLKKIDFNFKDDKGNFTADQITIGNGDFKQLDYHLPWDQSTYGYFYPRNDKYNNKNGNYIGQTNNNHNNENIPYYGEYFLVNKIKKQWADATAHGGENDYALYVDGTTEPGVVVSISTDTVICAGQTLYCSAWLCNPCPTSFEHNNPRNPIFRCNVEGRMKDYEGNYGDWEDISVFFVGQLPKGSGWQQIVFPVESEKSYDETRVSIYNFATGGAGNDFMVDDICLFASPLHLAGYQAQTNCASDANTESSTAVILRIDYSEFQGQRDQYMYYQIYNESKKDAANQMDAIVKLYTTLEDKHSAYYHDNPSNAQDTLFGSISIPKSDFDPQVNNADPEKVDVLIYNSVQEFKDALVDRIQERKKDAGTDPYEESEKEKAYIRTTDGKWLLYVMHIVPNAGHEVGSQVSEKDENKYLHEHYDYTLRMANVPEELNASECNMQTTLHATQATVFDLYDGCGKEKAKGFIPEKKDLCPNNLYTLRSMIENVMASQGGGPLQQVRGDVMADWLVGFDFDDAYAHTDRRTPEHKDSITNAREAFKTKYGYYRERIKTAILYDLRRPDPNNTNLYKTSFEDLDMNSFLDRNNYYIIRDLYQRGFLQLGKRTSTFYLGSNQTMRYWVYPIDGTATGKLGETTVALHDCSEPIWVMVSSASTDKMLNISPLPQDKKLAEEILAEHPTIMYEIPTIRIRKSQFKETITVPITEVSNVSNLKAEDNFIIDLSSNTVEFFDIENNTRIDKPDIANLEVGHKYTIRTAFNNGSICPNDGCQDVLYFHLLILPDAVVWTPAESSYNGWGLDENWRGWDDKDANGVLNEGELMEVGFVPIEGSDVIIPTLPDVTLYPYVHDHNHYPMDVNAHPSKCGNIHFEPGAHIHNQHLLQYTNAFVDMQITAGGWNMVSAPMKGMVSGDMFIPHNGMYYNNDASKIEEPNPFEVSGFQGTRSTNAVYAFWEGFYNTTVEKMTNNGAVNQTASAEFISSNTLARPLTPGTGYQLWGEGKTSQEVLTIRLPKPDEEYEYYSKEQPNGIKVEIPQTDRNRLAYTPTDGVMEIQLTNQTASEYFLFGNPTMAYIDMKAFFEDADNVDILSTVFHRMQDNSWRSGTGLTIDQDRYLAPMTSVMLETKDKEQSEKITVKLRPEHLTLNNQIYTIEEQSNESENAPQRLIASTSQQPMSSEIMTIYTSSNNAHARTILATNPIANDYYQIGEDALFISTGVENQSVVTSPLNMYTVAEQVPMMADVRQGISEIPLGMLVADGYHSQYMQVAFYLTANWSRECYFCDSKTGQKIRIMDGLVISVEMPQNHEQRYYIEGPDTYQGSNGVVTSTTQPTLSTTGNKVWAYAPDRGNVVVSSSDLIKSATLYDITGRLITQSPIANSQSPNNLMTNSLTLHTMGTAGVYIVDVTLRDGSTERAQVIVP